MSLNVFLPNRRNTQLSCAAVLFLVVGLLLPQIAVADGQSRPNILWITIEDSSPTLGCYGDEYANTPHIDALAESGVRFTQAFATTGVCATARSSLILGMPSSSAGSQHMRSVVTLPNEVHPFPKYLRDAGYYCANNVKTDYNFPVPEDVWDENSKNAHWRNRAPGQPFFAVFNTMTTHESRIRSHWELTKGLKSEQIHDPAKANLPSYLPDTPEVRKEWARYHDLLTRVDTFELPKLLNQLEEDGLVEDTIVFFFSDHGVGLPRAKQFIFDSGMQIPLIVHYPKKWEHLAPAVSGGTFDKLVSFIDFAPSVLEIADVSMPRYMQGESFTEIAKESGKRYVFGTRDRMDERIDMSRTVRDERFKYHRNYMPFLPHFPWLTYMEKLDTSKELRRLAAAGDLSDGLAYFMGPDKKLEELYDIEKDPSELNNLAGNPRYAKELRRLRSAHFAWVRSSVDTGLIPEQMLRDLSKGSSEYEYARSGDYPIEDCIKVTRLMEKGEKGFSKLSAALDDRYPAVRYWAAVGLSNLGPGASGAAEKLEKALYDPYSDVAIAAAETLCRLGQPEPALPILTWYIEHGRPLERLAAANVVDRIDEMANPIIETIQAEVAKEVEGDLGLMTQWALARALFELKGDISDSTAGNEDASTATIVGVASIDITPTKAVRLHGFPRGVRSTSNNEVTQRIYAKALAIGADSEDPVLLLTTDLLGVSKEIVDELFERLRTEVGFGGDRTRLAVTATHNHSAPAISSVAPYVFRQIPSKKDSEEMAIYRRFLMDQLVEVSRQALLNREPTTLQYGKGETDFAVFRRLVEKGEWVGFGENREGPVDHDVPVLSVRDKQGKLKAVWASYACHGVCWREPSVHGDWMGVAQAEVEKYYPGSVALITIGCAGDQDPVNATGGDPVTPGKAMAAELIRVLGEPGKSISGVPESRLIRFELPLQEAPGIDYWAERKDWYGQTAYKALQDGEALPSSIPYVVQTWNFGEDLALIFLAGEVGVEYGLTLKEKLHADRIWVNAYSNAMPAYIPAANYIFEGGWEVDGSRVNYGLPARLDPKAEPLLIDKVIEIVPEAFVKESDQWWKHTGHPKGKWWTTYPGYEGAAADEIWKNVEIPPSPVLSPEEALDSFVIADGFGIELVASEPLVTRPVHMAFDPAGRLWVVEMPGYMRDIDGTGEDDPSGRVVVLEDTNGDGKMDQSTVFLDQLVMPRTISLVENGALIVEPPNIWYAQDLDGDLKADKKTLVTDDYGVEGNPEHSANGLYRALDNWLYSAKSDVRYRFEKGGLTPEATAFRGQWGISQDDVGRLYYNYNASPLHMDLVPAQYLMSKGGIDYTKAANVVGPSLINYSLVVDRSIFAPRVTPLVTLGASDLRDDGTLKQFTSACSPLIYRGNQFGTNAKGDVFICEPVGNLVNRMKFTGDSLNPHAERVYEKSEFLASMDERFRPVFAQEGPDGAIYLADMYTGIVEHKRYVTDYLRSQVLGRGLGDFTDTGRIYRVVSLDAKVNKMESLDGLSVERLVEKLSSSNGWTRDTAQRLIVESGEKRAIAPLKKFLKTGETSLGRLHALWTLEGLNQMNYSTVVEALSDEDSIVQVAALRLSALFAESHEDQLIDLYRKLDTNEDDELRLQLALTLGQFEIPGILDMLAGIVENSDDWRLSAAVAASLSGREKEFLQLTSSLKKWRKPSSLQSQLLKQLGRTVIQIGEPSNVSHVLDEIVLPQVSGPFSRALLEGMALANRAGKEVTFSSEPKVLAALRNSDLEAFETKLNEKFTWPGKAFSMDSLVVELTQKEKELYDVGKASYEMICAACHQPNGEGLTGVAPSLVGSSWVNGSARVSLNIVLDGLTGPIEVNGEQWDLAMLGFGKSEAVLDDRKIAGVLTYIRRAWGNESAPVSVEDVVKARAENAGRINPWTAEELFKIQESEGKKAN